GHSSHGNGIVAGLEDQVHVKIWPRIAGRLQATRYGRRTPRASLLGGDGDEPDQLLESQGTFSSRLLLLKFFGVASR
ncbi:hypothetical protein E4U53_006225, partial [Claviceps sorghi]